MAQQQDLQEPAVFERKMMPVGVFFWDARKVFNFDLLSREILDIAIPAALAVAADPIASLIDTAFIGHIGPTELAAAGVAIALYNQASRITILPLVSITTSYVAEEDTVAKMKMKLEKIENIESSSDMLDDVEKGAFPPSNGKLEALSGELPKSNGSSSHNGSPDGSEAKESTLHNVNLQDSEQVLAQNVKQDDSNKTVYKDMDAKVKKEKRHIASASTALIFGVILGIMQAACLFFGAKFLLRIMGVKPHSAMLGPAILYLKLRSFGAPAFLLALAIQGIFRGLKDTRTPLYVILAGYSVNIALDPLLIFVFRWGIRGAAISHVLAQYLMALVLFLILMRKVQLLPPSLKELQFGRFLRNGTLLMFRVIAVTFCVTLAASLAARLGTTPMAAFQACLQVWFTSSLLSDGLAVGGQAILACAFAEKDYKKAQATATRVLQMSFILGVGLAIIVGMGLYFGAGAFSSNVDVLRLIKIGLPFVAATQPINSLSFVFDGVNFGASDFSYCAYSLILVAGASIASLFLLSEAKGFVGIWTALTIYMGLRTLAGALRIGTGSGPWRFLRG